MTGKVDRDELLRVAREAIVSHVTGAAPPRAGATDAQETAGGDVMTIHVDRTLRGCIGNLSAGQPLARVVGECAVAACSADPRFEPVTADDLPALDVEISLLGPMEPIASPDEIEIGRHGLVVEQGWRRGLLLPQVATEWKWDRQTFLAHTCHKAGLARDAWKRDVRMVRFEADVFGERRNAEPSEEL
jgi:AmmeMemoRadiSam system protein A